MSLTAFDINRTTHMWLMTNHVKMEGISVRISFEDEKNLEHARAVFSREVRNTVGDHYDPALKMNIMGLGFSIEKESVAIKGWRERLLSAHKLISEAKNMMSLASYSAERYRRMELALIDIEGALK